MLCQVEKDECTHRWQGRGLIEALSLVDRSSDLPLHAQVRRGLVELIQSAAKDRTLPLPSESELMDAFGVSRITVRRALGDLASAGYVVRQAGKGSYALPQKLRHTSGRIEGASEEFRAQGFTVTARLLDYAKLEATSEIGQSMGVPEGTRLQFARRLVIADGKPISIVRIYLDLPTGVQPTPEDISGDSIFKVLHRKWGLVAVRAVRTMEASLASKEDIELLGLDSPAAVFIADMVAYDQSQRPFALINVRYDSAYYKYVHEFDLPSIP